MSFEPLWFSSIFGVMFVIGQVLTMLSFFLLFLPYLAKFEPMNTTLTESRLHNIGKLQFAFIVFWTYVSVSQFVIIYAANLPEEISWYMNRAGAPEREPVPPAHILCGLFPIRHTFPCPAQPPVETLPQRDSLGGIQPLGGPRRGSFLDYFALHSRSRRQPVC
jgi:hypothetical protein